MSDLALVHVNDDDITKAEKATKVPIVNDGDNNDRYSISLLFIRTVLQRVFAIMLGMEPEWVEALKLLNKLTVAAPLASVLADEDYIEVDPYAFKLGKEGAPLKSKMASYFDDPSFGEKDRKFIDMVNEIPSLADISELATIILHRLLGHQGLLYDAVKRFKPQEFILAISELINDHYMISSKTVESLRDHFRKMKYVMGSNMKEYLKALQLLSTQIHCDGMAHNGTPGPTFRYMLQKFVDSIDTCGENNAFDVQISKAEDYLDDAAKVTRHMYTKIKMGLVNQAKKKFPETNSNSSSLTSLIESSANSPGVSAIFSDLTIDYGVGDDTAMVAFNKGKCAKCNGDGHQYRDCPTIDHGFDAKINARRDNGTYICEAAKRRSQH